MIYLSVVWNEDDSVTNRLTLSEDKLTVSIDRSLRARIATNEIKSSGKWYAEFKIYESSGLSLGVYEGLKNFSESYDWSLRRVYSSQDTYENCYPSNFNNGDIVSLLINMDEDIFSIMINGVHFNEHFYDISDLETVKIAVINLSSSARSIVEANFGASPFVYKIPWGYKSYDGSQSNINKTLILSDGEYKRYDEEVKVDKTPKMTSNTSPTPYKVTTSSEQTNENYHAFNSFSDSDTYRWLTNYSIQAEWIKIDFSQGVVINRYSLTNNYGANGSSMAKDFKLYGSNDDKEWVLLDSRYNQVAWKPGEQRLFGFENNKSYRFYKIEVLKNNGSTTKTVGKVNMLYVQLPSWKTVSTTLPTAYQFQEEGMEDLSILDRQVQPVLNSPIQMTDDGVLGEGKVYKGTVDLKKYFDLRKLEVK